MAFFIKPIRPDDTGGAQCCLSFSYGGYTVENSSTGESSGFALHTLIPLEDFKAILGIDDRGRPGEREGRGTSGNVHAGERAGAFGTLPAEGAVKMPSVAFLQLGVSLRKTPPET
jgi:hypothetical protein